MAERDCSMDERQKMHEDDWVYKDTRPISDEYTKAEIDEKLDAVDVKFNSYLSLDGGALTGNIIERNTDSDHLGVSGSYWGHGAYLWLSGQNSGYAGAWYLSARDTEKSCDLIGSPAGVLSWGGKLVATEDDLANYATKTELNAKQDALSNQQIQNIADVTNKANDADVVHIKGTDDIIDSKTFISLYTQSSEPCLWMKNTSFTMGSAPATNRYSGIWVQDNAGTDTAYIVHQANKNNSQNLKFSVSNTDGTTVYQNALTFQGRLDGTFNFYSDNPANLGTSTNQWKSFNGINPGALSLPSTSYINVDTSSFALDGVEENVYIPEADGYLAFYTLNGKGTFNIFDNHGTIYLGAHTGPFGFRFPVCKGRFVRMYLPCTSFGTFRFFPCQGNV